MLPSMLGLGQNMPGAAFMNSYYPFIIAIVIGFFFGLRHYFRGPQWTELGDMTKKVVIVTGANSGIGFELAKTFCEHGAKVYLACRSKEKALEAIDLIKLDLKSSPTTLHFLPLDLASFHSVKAFADAFLKRENRLDILVNNAGVLAPPGPQVTQDGHEIHFQVNYLGHFLLTHLLLDLLKATANSKIINNTSHAHNLVTLNLQDVVPQSFLSSESLPPPPLHPSSYEEIDHVKNALFVVGDDDVDVDAVDDDDADDDDADKMSGDKKSLISTSKKETVKVGQGQVEGEGEGQVEGEGEGGNKELTDDEEASLKNRNYAYSKLASLLFTHKLANILSSVPPAVMVVNPGVVSSDIYRHMTFRTSMIATIVTTPFMWYLTKNCQDGAQTTLYCCSSADVDGQTGKCFKDCALSKLKEGVIDDKMADTLYDISSKICSHWM